MRDLLEIVSRSYIYLISSEKGEGGDNHTNQAGSLHTELAIDTMARAVPRHSRVAAEATAERADEVEVKPLPLVLGVRAGLHDWHTWLVQPVHASSLGVFRVVFSICMYVQATHFNYIFEDFMTSKGVYPYPGLGWIRPPPPAVGEMLLRLNKVRSALTRQPWPQP